MNLEQFAERIRNIGTSVVVNVDRNVNETAALCLTTIVTATPVDTGRARSNWVVSIGTPFLGTKGPPFDKSGASAIATGRSVASSRPPESPASIYICNNLPYIQRLNEGWSAQAPAGYVQEAVQTAIAYLRSRRVLPP